MQQKILVALDDSPNAMRAVEQVARTYTPKNEITLYSVLPQVDFGCIMDLNSLNREQLDLHYSLCSDMQKQKENQVERALDEAKNLLIKSGFDEKTVTVKVDRKGGDVAREIINEANTGYDTIVMGRRGMTALKAFFIGSISQKVLHAVKDKSVLIVG